MYIGTRILVQPLSTTFWCNGVEKSLKKIVGSIKKYRNAIRTSVM